MAHRALSDELFSFEVVTGDQRHFVKGNLNLDSDQIAGQGIGNVVRGIRIARGRSHSDGDIDIRRRDSMTDGALQERLNRVVNLGIRRAIQDRHACSFTSRVGHQIGDHHRPAKLNDPKDHHQEKRQDESHLNHGRTAESGRHAELMAIDNGLYQRLYLLQQLEGDGEAEIQPAS